MKQEKDEKSIEEQLVANLNLQFSCMKIKRGERSMQAVKEQAGPRVELINYAETKQVYLETGDYRLYEHPYGPRYPEAVGKVFRWTSTERGNAADADEAFVKSVSPDVFDVRSGGSSRIGQVVPIKVYRQFKHEDGLVLVARVEYNHRSRVIDIGGYNGTWLILIVFTQSASRKRWATEE